MDYSDYMDYAKEQRTLGLLEELESILEEAKTSFMTSKASVDKEEVLEKIGEIRESLPMDMMRATWIVQEHDMLVKRAQEEAEIIIREAKERADEMIENHEITKFAKNLAESIEDNARENAVNVNNQNIDQLMNHYEELEETLNEKKTRVDRSVKLAVDNLNKELERTMDSINRTVKSALAGMIEEMEQFDEDAQQVLVQLYDERRQLEELLQGVSNRKEDKEEVI